MKKSTAFVLIITACLFLPQTASPGTAMEFRQRSRLIIENGRAYKLAPALYAELDVEKDKITRTLYDLDEKNKRAVSTTVFQVISKGEDSVTTMMPKWLKGIKKFLRQDLPKDHEMVIKAIYTEICVNFLSVGETFMIEVHSRPPYPGLDYGNVIEYGYYERVK